MLPSFVLPPEIHPLLRNLTRNRVRLMGDRTRDADRLEKLLEDAPIKLSVVASNITGTSSLSGDASHTVAGERDPAVTSDMAHSTLRRKTSDLTEALTGLLHEHHAVLVCALLTRLEHSEAVCVRPTPSSRSG